MKLCLLGGGGFRVPLVYRALLADHAPGRVTHLRLFDTDQRRLSTMLKVLRDQARNVPDAPVVSMHTDLAEAVAGVDFVFSAIRAGGIEGRVIDERVALQHGVIGQETVGAGGIAYALRSIPAALHIARTIRKHAPDAWTINFTNPAGVVTEAMTRELGGKVVGICDSPVGLARHVTAAMGVNRGNVEIDYVGLNHLGWLRGLTVDGHDVLRDLMGQPEIIHSFEEGRLFGSDLIRDLGAVPNEYLYYYYFSREALAADMAAEQPRGLYLAEQQRRFYDSCGGAHVTNHFTVWDTARLEREHTYMATVRESAGGMERDESDLESGGYDRVALSIMRAISRDEEATLILNVPNKGLLPHLDSEAVIEVPCRVAADGIHALPTAPLPEHARGLVQQVKYVERCELAAVEERSATAAIRALAAHPLIDSLNVARLMFASYREQLPGLSYLS